MKSYSLDATAAFIPQTGEDGASNAEKADRS